MARILITGSNSGFGLLHAHTCGQGHDVIATMRDPAKGTALLEACEAEGLAVEIRRLDVTVPASVDAAIHDPGEIDVLVNNAGFEVRAAIEQLTDELMHQQLDTNVMGPLRTMRAVLTEWRLRGSGVIVNVSSIACASALRWRVFRVKYALDDDRGVALRDGDLRYPLPPD